MNRRYYQTGAITIQVDSDLPFQESTFLPKFDSFRIMTPGKDIVTIHHHFTLPELSDLDTGEVIHQSRPWIIHRTPDLYIFRMVGSGLEQPLMVGLFSHDFGRGDIYSRSPEIFLRGNLHSLTMFPTDQILLSPLLAGRNGLLIHAAGMVIDGQGLLFVGHSEAGKSTTVTMLRELGEILCDDRIIVRSNPGGFSIHGTWSHGTVPDVSAGSAPLRAVMMLEKSQDNRVVPMDDRGEVLRLLPRYTIKSLLTPDWWIKTLDVLGALVRQVPVYRLQLDRSGRVKDVISDFLAGR